MIKISEQIVANNNQYIAFNKPTGMSVQPDTTPEKSLLELAEIYTKRKLFIVHRIDRPASGVVVLAKTERAAQELSAQFKNRIVEKVYLAVVKNTPIAPEGTLQHHLKKILKLNKSIVVAEPTEDSKEAILHYKVLQQSDNYQLLRVELQTGRFHQIRAQLATIDCPIKGDVKYGFRRSNSDRSIHLHAWQLQFQHPVTKELIHLIAPPPDEVLWNGFDLSDFEN